MHDMAIIKKPKLAVLASLARACLSEINYDVVVRNNGFIVCVAPASGAHDKSA
jgi:hypothetical protein